MSEKKYSLKKLRKKLGEKLVGTRYEHCLGTEEKAVELAKRFGVDIEKAAVAGLLHDCARFMSKKDIKNYALENKLPLSEESLNAPSVIHSEVGAYMAKEYFNIEDEEIINAIRNHTTGNINMTMLEKVVYIADKIEDRTRIGEYFDNIRDALEHTNNIDEGILVSYGQTIKGLVDKNYHISLVTIRNWNDLIKKTNRASSKTKLPIK